MIDITHGDEVVLHEFCPVIGTVFDDVFCLGVEIKSDKQGGSDDDGGYKPEELPGKV